MRRPHRIAPLGAGLVALAGFAGLTGCTGAGGGPGPAALRPEWLPVALPGPPAGRVTVRALAGCAGRLYAVGATVTRPDPAGAGTGDRTAGGDGPAVNDSATYRPAAWRSTDGGRTWSAVPLRPTGAYGPKQVLSSAACTGDRLVAVGGVGGGVHGNLRTSTWLAVGDGPLTEIRAPFEQYGGPEQLDTGRVAAGPRGFVIEGDRAHPSPGAAVWASADGSAFTLVDGDPALVSTPERSTVAADVAALPDGSWLLVGSATRPGQVGRRDPLAWHSTDGRHWRPVAGPPADPDEAFDRVAVAGDTVTAAGPSGQTFAIWRMPAAGAASGTPTPGAASGTATAPAGWQRAGVFDRLGGTEPAAVVDLAPLGGGPAPAVVAAVDNGTDYRVWLGSPDLTRWREVGLPVPLAAGEGHRLSLRASGTVVILATEDGAATRLWRTDLAM